MDIQLQITATGAIQMLHSDLVDLSQLGRISSTVRASHVEPRVENGQTVWSVASAKTGKTLADWFPSRADALAWEQSYYSPGHPGWIELTGQEIRR